MNKMITSDWHNIYNFDPESVNLGFISNGGPSFENPGLTSRPCVAKTNLLCNC